MIALGVFLGLALPPLAALLKPLLMPAIVGPFLVALIRLDWRRLTGHLRPAGGRPRWRCCGCWWCRRCWSTRSPARWRSGPALHGGIVLMAAAPPLMASGALALMLGLDVALAVVVTTLATALMPLTVPPIALHLLGHRDRHRARAS